MQSELEARLTPRGPDSALANGRPTSQRGGAKNRSRLDTVAEVIDACMTGANKSRIMLVANVNSVVATELVGKLISSRLLSPRNLENGGVAYFSTQEGVQFVRRYSDLVSMLCPGLVPPSRINDPSRGAEAWI